ncbi:hypothetical protein [Anaerovorax odorimutans]|uniref:hypothetical protein n=1 Tax=Anaerovorax odorimutans TaxID=109327 RepID=UPI0003FB5799|nr:hypothetical protein [Anaerovorax odorimutans]
MDDYKNILRIETLNDGTMNILLRNGKRALIEIKRLNKKFEAAIFHMLVGDPDLGEEKARVSIMDKLNKHDAYKECAKEAIGWIDSNYDKYFQLEETKEPYNK